MPITTEECNGDVAVHAKTFLGIFKYSFEVLESLSELVSELNVRDVESS